MVDEELRYTENEVAEIQEKYRGYEWKSPIATVWDYGKNPVDCDICNRLVSVIYMLERDEGDPIVSVCNACLLAVHGKTELEERGQDE